MNGTAREEALIRRAEEQRPLQSPSKSGHRAQDRRWEDSRRPATRLLIERPTTRSSGSLSESQVSSRYSLTILLSSRTLLELERFPIQFWRRISMTEPRNCDEMHADS